MKDRTFCVHCYWAHPEEYEHIAGKHEKVISIMFTEDEIEDYNKLIEISGLNAAQDTIKKILHDFLKS